MYAMYSTTIRKLMHLQVICLYSITKATCVPSITHV